MRFEELRKEDVKLIKDAMLENSVSIIAEYQANKETISKDTYRYGMTKGKRLVYLLNVLNHKKEYDYNRYIKVKVTIVKTDGGEIRKIIEEFPYHLTDNDINEMLWDKYSDEYNDIQEILWDEIKDNTHIAELY